MATIGKGELVKLASKKTDLSQMHMKVAYECFCEAIREQIMEGHKVTLERIGTFTPIIKEAGTARNPSTGKTIEVDARLMLRFAVNTNFKLAMREIDVDSLLGNDDAEEEDEKPAKIEKKAKESEKAKAKSKRRR